MNRTSRRARVLWVGIIACLWSVNAALADHGRFLLDEDAIGNYDDFGWFSDDPIEFNQDVICPDEGKIGEIRFSYDTWIGTIPDSDPEVFTGGAGLAGGFFLTEDCELAPGWQYGWVQIVRSTFSGNNIWDAPNGEWFPDTNSKEDPDYPLESLPELDNPPDPAPTVAFQDLPNRFFSNGNQFWQAELGLVCKNLETAEMHVLSTFLWGFDVVTEPIANLGITQGPPGFWSDASPNFIDTLTSHYNGLDGSVDWSVERGCCECVPEPTTWMLAGIGLVGLLRFRGRRSKHAARQVEAALAA